MFTVCGKGFCHVGWLDRHKLSSESCASSKIVDNNIGNTANKHTKQEMATTSDKSHGPSRNRASLTGRLDELLCCPNANCNFATYWLQSLTKHVNHTCKYGANSDTTQDSANISTLLVPNPVSKILVPIAPKPSGASITCVLCNKKCTDTQDHINHMTTQHHMKACYRCSTCGQKFPNKNAVETHLQTHSKTTKIDGPVQVTLSNQNNQNSSDTGKTEATPHRKNSFEENEVILFYSNVKRLNRYFILAKFGSISTIIE